MDLKERKKYGIRIVNISVGTNPGLTKTKRTVALDAVELPGIPVLKRHCCLCRKLRNGGGNGGSSGKQKSDYGGVPDSNLPFEKKQEESNYSGRELNGECVVKPDVLHLNRSCKL